LIVLLIVFSLGVFLTATVLTTKPVPPPPVKKVQPLPPPPKTKRPLTLLEVSRNGKVMRRHEKSDTIQESVRRLLRSLPDKIVVENYSDDVRPPCKMSSELALHGYGVASVSVGKSFYMYDCSITQADDHLVVVVLMELPEIAVVLRDHADYSKFYPNINPYVHAVELVYKWGYDADTLETHDAMHLTNLRIFMVSWEDNLYRKSHEQVKNSPLYRVPVPTPLNLKKEDLYDFLMGSGIFKHVPMIFDPPIVMFSLQDTTPV
jgi:hypothetical protein